MLVLVIFATIFLIAFTSVVAITIAYESLTLDKTPEWLENAYDFVWDNLEKVFVR
jgi:uncharacterized membrane protein